jgi:DNA-3-methyladenine glycosylase II
MSIMSQQLSTKVAHVIHRRFLALFGTKTPTPEQILAMAPEKLRAIGLSNAKTSYVRNVALFAIENGIEYKHLNKLSNEEVITYLTGIKGIGRWTVEMQLMFTLGREDVFAVDDLGIQKAMIKLYRLKSGSKKELREKMLELSQKWSPYRTYACLHLWHWKDNKPVS